MFQSLNEVPRFVVGEQVVVNGLTLKIESVEAERLTLGPPNTLKIESNGSLHFFVDDKAEPPRV